MKTISLFTILLAACGTEIYEVPVYNQGFPPNQEPDSGVSDHDSMVEIDSQEPDSVVEVDSQEPDMGAVDSQEPDSQPEPDFCAPQHREGLYRVSFAAGETSCGDYHDQLVLLDGKDSPPDGCSGQMTAYGCKVEVEISCPIIWKWSMEMTGQIEWWFGGDRGEGILKLLAVGADNEGVCGGRYNVVFERL